MSTIEIPGYKIIKTLGFGGQATVYLAIQQGFDREVALKVMSPALAADPSFGERFVREAKIVAQLSHHRIVTVYDVGKSGHYYFLAMEYMRGEELKSKISQGLKATDALQIIAKLAKALHFAHQKGYIHRDVKSENILFNDNDQPVLTDFGIAKASNSSTQMTQTGKLIGTPEYMSPEQCRGKELDGRSDLYSLGIILYEMLTRQVPFTGEDSVSICIKHVTKPVPKLPARFSHYQWLVDSLLAKNPDNRFQTGQEVSEAIHSYLQDGHPVRFESSSPAKTRISGVVDIPVLSDELEQMESEQEQDEFGLSDNFYVEKPFVAPENKSWVGSISWLIIILVVGITGYINRSVWLPKMEQYIPAQLLELTRSKPAAVKQTDSRGANVDKAINTNPVDTSPNTSRPKPKSNTESNPQEAQKIFKKIRPHLDQKTITLEGLKAVVKQLLLISSGQASNRQLTEFKTQVNQIAIQQAVKATQKRDYQGADAWLQAAQDLDPDNQDLTTSRQALVIQENAYKQQVQQEQALKRSAQLKQKVDSFLSLTKKAIKGNQLAKPAEKNAIFYLEQAKALNPKDPRIEQYLKQIERRYVSFIKAAIKNEKLTQAADYFKSLKKLAVKKDQYLTLENKLIQAKQRYAIKERERKRRARIAEEQRLAAQKRKEKLSNPLIKMQIDSNLESANNLMLLGYLVEPIGNNALEKYQVVLSIDDQDVKAKAGILSIQSTIHQHIQDYLSQKKTKKAIVWVTKLRLFDPLDDKLSVYDEQLKQLHE